MVSRSLLGLWVIFESGVAETKNAANNHSLQLVGQASVRFLFCFIFLGSSSRSPPPNHYNPAGTGPQRWEALISNFLLFARDMRELFFMVNLL
jgi:hypothetical protein